MPGRVVVPWTKKIAPTWPYQNHLLLACMRVCQGSIEIIRDTITQKFDSRNLPTDDRMGFHAEGRPWVVPGSEARAQMVVAARCARSAFMKSGAGCDSSALGHRRTSR